MGNGLYGGFIFWALSSLESIYSQKYKKLLAESRNQAPKSVSLSRGRSYDIRSVEKQNRL